MLLTWPLRGSRRIYADFIVNLQSTLNMWVRKGTLKRINSLPRFRNPRSGSQTWFLRQFLSLSGVYLGSKNGHRFLAITVSGVTTPLHPLESPILLFCSEAH